MSVPIPVERIAFGVRYDPQWAVADRRGGVIDYILRHSGTPFGPKTFPQTTRIDEAHVLLNNDTHDTLRVSERDLILEMQVEDISAVPALAEGFEKKLRVANQRHDMIALRITDPRELALPPVGLIHLEDPETGGRILVNTRSRKLRRRYERLTRKRLAKQEQTFGAMNVDHVDIRIESSYVEPLVRFFRMRERRLAAGK